DGAGRSDGAAGAGAVGRDGARADVRQRVAGRRAGTAAVDGQVLQAGSGVGVVHRDVIRPAQSVDRHVRLVGEIEQLERAAGTAVDLGGRRARNRQAIDDVDDVGGVGGVERDLCDVHQVVDGGEVRILDDHIAIDLDGAGVAVRGGVYLLLVVAPRNGQCVR